MKETHLDSVLTDEPSFASHFVASINDKGNGHVLSFLWASLPHLNRDNDPSQSER